MPNGRNYTVNNFVKIPIMGRIKKLLTPSVASISLSYIYTQTANIFKRKQKRGIKH